MNDNLGRRRYVITIGLLLAGVASGQQASEKPEDAALRLMKEAVAAETAGRVSEAGALYLTAFAMETDPALLRSAADVFDKAGHLKLSAQLLRRFITLRGKGAEAQLAKQKLAAIHQRLSVLATKAVLFLGPQPPGTQISINEKAVAVDASGLVVVSPGKVVLRVVRPDIGTFEKSLELTAGARETVTLRFNSERTLLRLNELPRGAVATVNGKEHKLQRSSMDIPVPPGTFTVSVKAPGYVDWNKSVTVNSGAVANVTCNAKRSEVDPKTGEWLAWSGIFTGRAIDGASPFVNARLMLNENEPTRGVLRITGRRVLTTHYRQKCNQAEEATWTETHPVQMVFHDRSSGLMKSERPTMSDCSCPGYCPDASSDTWKMTLLPGREGMVVDGALLLRERLAPRNMAGTKTADVTALNGTWDIVTHNGKTSDLPSLEFVDGQATLTRSQTLSTPSYQRSRCNRAPTYTQTVAYPITATRTGADVALTFSPGQQTACSCPAACNTPPLMGAMNLILLEGGFYLWNSGTLLRRRGGAKAMK